MPLTDMFPEDLDQAALAGRILTEAGPTPILILKGQVYDATCIAPTVSLLMAAWPEGVDMETLTPLGSVEDLFAVAGPMTDRLLSPVDLQCLKAAGVTFAVSAVERVIEERARGDADKAQSIRDTLKDRIGTDIRAVVPGSDPAARLKDALISDGLWSQYLEVAIGPDAEVFTKGPVLSSVGYGAEIGVRSDSTWNNPEPEVAVVVDPGGRIVGACLANDVNLRCFEGRSALLLGKAKDNNASCALGPFIRLFDETFSLDEVRRARLDLKITGEDQYVLKGASTMTEISRDPSELVRQTLSQHDYPDGFILMCGTLFAPTQDRDVPGRGFTHKVGDVVEIQSPRLGRLSNRVVLCKDAAPWDFGIYDLMHNLAERGLLGRTAQKYRQTA